MRAASGGLLLALMLFSSLAAGQESADAPSGFAEPRELTVQYPDGTMEFVPSVGWIVFDEATALEDGLLFGGEFAHHFIFDNPLFAVGAFIAVEGTLTKLVGSIDDDIDVILASVGTMFSYRGWGRFIPTVRAGGGFVVIDGTKSELPIRGRGTLIAGLTLRYFVTDWFLLRADVRTVIYDNLQLGAGSGQLQNVTNWLFSFGIGVVR